jgi:uncharacterized membrane protein (DUF373 family)
MPSPTPKPILSRLLRLFSGFEVLVNLVLLVLMAVIVIASIVDLACVIFESIFLSPPFGRIGVDRLLNVFGDFLLVLIGVELVESVRSYIEDKTVHVEVILAVGLVAITRKIIVLEPGHTDAMNLFGVATVTIALAAAFFLVHRARSLDQRRRQKNPIEKSP